MLDWSVAPPAGTSSEGVSEEVVTGGTVIGSGAVAPNPEKGEVLVGVCGTAMMRPPM
jgi:hypothetical protein